MRQAFFRNFVRQSKCIVGLLLLVSGALMAMANEFIMENGVRSILGTGGEPSTIGMVLVIAGLVLRQGVTGKQAC